MNTQKINEVEQVIHKEYESFYRIAYTYVKNEHDALDIVQESIYKAIKGAKTLKDTTYIKAWIGKIVVNTSLDFLRKRKRETSLAEWEEESVCDSYVDLDLQNYIKELNEKEQTILLLHYFEGHTLREVAKCMGEKESTIKSLLYRGLNKLKSRMKEEQ